MDLALLLKALTAMAPVLVLLLVFDRLDVFNLINFRTITLLVLTGGAVAAVSFLVNWRAMDGFPIGFSAYSRYVAPIVEESLKAAPIIGLFASNRLGFKLDAAIAGFAVGAGFSMVENGWYLGSGFAGANFSAWLVRGFGAAVMHGGATAVFSVVAHEMTERQAEAEAVRYRFSPVLFLPGLAVAIAIHSAFNHFPNQPLAAMALTLLLTPAALFVTFARSEQATHRWIAADAAAHRQALADIRAGRFTQSQAGQALQAHVRRLQSARTDEVFAYIELKTELALRAEELMLAVEDGRAAEPDLDDIEKFTRLDALEQRLGWPVLTAIAPHLHFSRNDLWEIARLKDRVREARAEGSRTEARPKQ